jgi:hypothetical protein
VQLPPLHEPTVAYVRRVVAEMHVGGGGVVHVMPAHGSHAGQFGHAMSFGA